MLKPHFSEPGLGATLDTDIYGCLCLFLVLKLGKMDHMRGLNWQGQKVLFLSLDRLSSSGVGLNVRMWRNVA